MRIQTLGFALSTIIALANAKLYKFNVVSILGEGYSLGVKYGRNEVPLKATAFPLFTGEIETRNLSKYKYIAYKKNKVVGEESITRTYSEKTSLINEVYNRTNTNIVLPKLPNPLDPVYPMGSKKFQPLPDNFIYNFYAKCDENGYKNSITTPFFEGYVQNDAAFNCSFTIITPDTVFQDNGTMHLIGFGSRFFKKLSWSIKFSNKKFMGRKTMKLRGNANDLSLMREKLSTTLYTTVGVPTQEGAYARVFINGDTYGLYLLSDSTNKRWTGAYIHGDEKAKTGVSYKLVSSPGYTYASLRYIDENYKSYSKSGNYELDEYEKDEYNENDGAALWSHMIRFTKLYAEWVEKYKDDVSDEAIEALQKFLNIESVIRLLVMDTLIMPLDNFWLIMSNASLYYDPERDQYMIIPYDFDQTFRGSWEVESINPTNYISDCITWVNYNEKLYEHYFTNHLLEHPQIKKRYDVIMNKVVYSTYDSKRVTEYIQTLAKLIYDDVQWNIDAVNNLNIPYNGNVKQFTLKQFEKSYTDTYNKNKGITSSYNFKEFIDIRGDNCRAYAADVDTTDNSNIGSKKVVEEPVDFAVAPNVAEQVAVEEVPTAFAVASGALKTYKFNVVSILGEGSKMGVKYGKTVVPLEATAFPLFTGSIEASEITNYKYVSLDNLNNIIEEESIERVYSEENSSINEVYNRSTKNHEITKLPSPLESIYPLGAKKFPPLPDNYIYNVYAKCDEAGYTYAASQPFLTPPYQNSNNTPFNCTFTIITPDEVFQDSGSMHLIGFTSRLYKKLSWSLKFNEKKFMGRKTIKLRGNANDASLMREKVAMDMYISAGVPTQNASYARVFINGDTYGLYFIGDSSNKRWAGAYIHGDPKSKSGYSYRLMSSQSSGNYATLKYIDDNYRSYSSTGNYQIDEFDGEVDATDKVTQWAPFIRFTKLFDEWVKTYTGDDSAEAVTALQKFFNLESLLRLLAVDTLVMPLDNFFLIMSNSGLYYDPERENFTIIPYDLDQSLRGSWDVPSVDPENYIYDCITWVNYNETMYEHYFTNHILEHPQIKNRYDVILKKLVYETFSNEVMTDYLTDIADLIREDVEWNVDVVEKLDTGYSYGKIKSFTLKKFESTYTATYKKNAKVKGYYELKEYIDIRGDACRAYTADVDDSNSDILSTGGTATPGEMNSYDFSVISILGKGYNMGVKYGKTVYPLNATLFPLFTGTVKASNIVEYKYVALNELNEVVAEESLVREYSADNAMINEVYDRTNKEITLPELTTPLEPLFDMGTEKFPKFPDNVIYNVYAECDEVGYRNVTTNPFFNGRSIRNDQPVDCTFNIISPTDTYTSPGTIKLIGYGSRRFKKLSWNIKLDGKKFMGRKAIKMRALANDDSLVREKYATHLYNTVGVPTQEGAYARFYINGDTYGLYLLTDTFNKRWMGAYIHHDEKAKVGVSYNLFSTIPNGPYASLKYIDDNYKTYKNSGSYNIDEYEEDDEELTSETARWARFMDLVKLYDNWVKTYKNDKSIKAVEALQEFLDVEELLRLLVVDTLVMPLDNFWLIMSNAEIYYNPVTGKYQFVPFDFDQSLVGSWGIQSLNPDNYMKDCLTWVNYNETRYEHYFTNNILSHPQFKKRYDIILAQVTRSAYDSDVAKEYVGKVADLIRDDVQWNLDAVNNLDIPYEGKLTTFTLQTFERNFNYRRAGSQVLSSYYLWEFIDVRGGYCRDYTKNVDVKEDAYLGISQATTTTEVVEPTPTVAPFEPAVPAVETTVPEIPTTGSGHTFNVISTLGIDYIIGVKYNDKEDVVPLEAINYPLYSGAVPDKSIKTYKYVALNQNFEVIEEESFVRTYTKEIVNDVYNRSVQTVDLPKLAQPLESLYPGETESFQPIPDNVIYNVIATCDDDGYATLTTNPLSNASTKQPNNLTIDCSITIISPESTFQSDGSMKLYGSSLLRFKKLSWNVKFNEEQFMGRKGVTLKSIPNDASFMREKLASELYTAANVPNFEGAYARLFINGNTYGLYLMNDSNTEQWIRATIHGDENATVGSNYNLISTTPNGPYADLRYLGDNYKLYKNRGTYSLDKYDSSADVATRWSKLVEFTKLFDEWVNDYKNDNSEDALQALNAFLDVESTLRLMAIDTLILPLKNFWLTMSSTYLYYNPEKEYFQFIPYDFDESLVGSWDVPLLNSDNYIDDCITWANSKETIFEHYFTNSLLANPSIQDRYNVILSELLSKTYNSLSVDAYLTTLGTLIENDIQWSIDAINNLDIPYQGYIKQMSKKEYETNLTYRHKGSDYRSYFELSDFVATRSKKCNAYIKSI